VQPIDFRKQLRRTEKIRMRKHLTQMTREERAFVHGLIRSRLERVTGAPHFYDRATERTFTLSDAVRTLRCGLVVEVHNNTPGDIRALVRDSLGTCAVVSLRSWQIVTVYYNAPEDPHNTLDWTPYRWRTNLVELVKELRKVAA